MIKGLIAPILSPFNDDLSFNQDMYNALAAELLQTGCSGLAPFGTTGEALSVGSAERITALEGLVASGIDPKVIIPEQACATFRNPSPCRAMLSSLAAPA